jgi:O-antigen ligase
MIFSISALVAALDSPFSALTGLLLLLIAWWRLANSQSRPMARDALTFILLGWLFWLPLSMIWSLSPGVALQYVSVLLCLPLAWLTVRTITDIGQLDRALNLLLPLLLALMIGWAIQQGPATFTGKPQGPFNDPNAFAALLNLLLFPLLARWLVSDLTNIEPWCRTTWLALLGGGLFVFFLISSRGASLAFLCFAPLLFWQAQTVPAARRKLVLFPLVSVIAFAGAYYTTGGLNVASRLAELSAHGDTPRLMLLHSAWAMIVDHPWLGTGIGSFQLLYPRYRASEEIGTAGGWVHNDFLQLWQEAGLPMFFLMIGLFVWVLWRGTQTMRNKSTVALERLGYLAAVAAVLVHSTVNFLFYFSPITLLMGVYLARLQVADHVPAFSQGNGRNVRTLVAGGYALIVGFLLFGQVVVEHMLGDRHTVQRAFVKLNLNYPRNEIAYWLSVLAPFNPIPQQTLAYDTYDAMTLSHGDPGMLEEAFSRMEISIRLVPCYLPFTNAALGMLVKERPSQDLLQRGEQMAKQSMACAPRHGLTYYHTGLLAAMSPGNDPLQPWLKGLVKANMYSDQLLLATAIMTRIMPEQKQVLVPLVKSMAEDIRLRESRPGVQPDSYFWDEAQRKLKLCCGNRHEELINAARRVVIKR